ncbi:FAD/NAD(P)-binding domain-containing protein [Eremomyces bilateralis CBS 781.70]|uniref:FAD/NAD(P)-binding domain-containing protein n=1 Tax=Eremomyces bilateralis CBS 781.70 TaxID=1392243 RepID=A0A6G1FYE9_9PEZI|nr:FAD/NAD(P)-binding domain-containing protein [Eremomyces bilateralis CBS 781.70]KAF1810804.1 FAD/NAD(P)-binding domain-containing protein [Eremomyces bilateralis CBS 781.70]
MHGVWKRTMAQNTTKTPLKQIVILGGSYGGISTAHYLLKHVVPRLPENEACQVTLIGASSQAMCRPACPRALISDDMFPQNRLFVGIAELFKQYPKGSFRFVQGTAMHLDDTNRTVAVTLSDGGPKIFVFHALVIATGASTNSPLLGLHGDAGSLRASWAEFRDALPAAKSIVVVGGGPTGVETAAELGEYLNGRAGLFSSKLANPTVRITLVTSGPRILWYLPPSTAETAEKYLAAVGVNVIKNAWVTAIEPSDAGAVKVSAKAKLALDDGTTLDADLYIPATGTTPNTSFVQKSLQTQDGRVNTNPSTLRIDKSGPRIYAIGDASSAARPAIHLIFPAVPVLCANIKRDLLLAAGVDESSIGEDRIFKEDTRETQLVPVGRSKGVGAAMGYRLLSFLVWAIKGRDYWLWTTGALWSGRQWAKES